MCLRKLQKLANGQTGHETAQLPTLLKSWDEFQERADLIWNNAREYNEEGSEIVELAETLEEHFKNCLNKAKAAVDEPLVKKPLKLLLKDNKPQDPAPTPQLKLTQPKPPPKTSGISVDNEALKRQQELVNAGMSGQKQTPDVQKSSSVTRVNGSEPPSTNGVGVKRETSHAASPKPVSGLPNGTPAPPTTAAATATPQIPNTTPRPPVAPTPAAVPVPPAYSSSNFTSQIRPSGKGTPSPRIR